MAHEEYPDTHHDPFSKTIFGFWVYLLSDFVLFGVLFASYIVLRNNTFGGPGAGDFVNLPFTLVQTCLLLTATFTMSLASALVHRNNRPWSIALFVITFLLGLAFLKMEMIEFGHLIDAGNSWRRSGFLSAFFTLIGTHVLHVIIGLLWTIVLVVPICYKKITTQDIRRLTCLKMFWQFINIVWVYIFIIVYLMGAS